MRKKKKRVGKYITLLAASEKQLTSHKARNLSRVETECLSSGLYGPGIYRAATKYMCIIYLL